MSQSIEEIPVIILCGGRGTRMGSLTDKTPKALILIQGEAIIWYIIQSLYIEGFRRFILPLGYKGEMIQKYVEKHLSNMPGIQIKCLDTGENTNIAKRVSTVIQQEKFDSEILLLNSDAIFDFSLSDKYHKHIFSRKFITLISVAIHSQWGLILENETQIKGFVRDHKVQYFVSSTDEGYRGYIYSGMAFINKNILDQIDLTNSQNFENDLYSNSIESAQLGNEKADGFWFSIDTPKDISKLNNENSRAGSHLKAIRESISGFLEIQK